MILIRSLFVAGIVVAALFLISQYMYVLPIHIGTFVFTILLVVAADAHGFLWIIGKLQTLPKARMLWLHRLVSLGLLVALTTGALMAWPVLDYLLETPAFLAKMVFVAALVINSIVIAKHMDVAFEKSFSSLTIKEKIPLFISGAISSVSWVGAFVAAQFLGLS